MLLALSIFLRRIRHFRGRGIHSPFVYSLVRNVFMQREITGDSALYGRLRAHGIRRSTARELQNLHSYCGYTPADICVVLPGTDVPEGRLATALVRPSRGGPDRARYDAAGRGGDCLCVDRGRYKVLFRGGGLPKQTFKL